MIINIRENNNIISMFMKTGFKVFIFITSITFRSSLDLIYQYVGSKWAKFNTFVGIYCIGTNAPHKKLEPKATTLTIPFIAFLSFTILPIKKAIDIAHIVKIREFNMKRSP